MKVARTQRGGCGKNSPWNMIDCLPSEDCFFDSRTGVCGSCDKELPFAITTKISSNNQQFLKLMDKEETDKVMQIGNLIKESNYRNPHRGRVYSSDGISPALNCNEGGQREVKIVEDNLIVPTNTATGYNVVKPDGVYDAKYPTSKTRRGRVQGDGGDISPTLTADIDLRVFKGRNYKIRKLTPRECFRLMGVDEADIDTILSTGIADSNLYKLAGNSIVVDTLYWLFYKLLINTKNDDPQLTLF